MGGIAYERNHKLRKSGERYYSADRKNYRVVLKSLKANPRSQTAMSNKNEIDQFFRSEWYAALTSVGGEMLIRFPQMEVNA